MERTYNETCIKKKLLQLKPLYVYECLYKICSSKNGLVRIALNELKQVAKLDPNDQTQCSLLSVREIRAMSVTACCIWGKISSGKEDCRQHPVSHYKKKEAEKHTGCLSRTCMLLRAEDRANSNYETIQIHIHTYSNVYPLTEVV